MRNAISATSPIRIQQLVLNVVEFQIHLKVTFLARSYVEKVLVKKAKIVIFHTPKPSSDL